MPFFRRRPAGPPPPADGAPPPTGDELRARAEAAAADRERSTLQLEQGGLPVAAEQRLRELREGDGSFFTSDLSVDEFAFCDLDGLRPLTQVMGSSVYHVGFQWMPSYRGWGSSQELVLVSAAWNEARRLALDRLRQEARLAGAHAVLGVRLTRVAGAFAEDSVEWLATGTAVAIAGTPVPEQPALSDLSAQDFWKLRRAGWSPVGVIGHTTSFYIVASYATQRAMRGGVLFGGGRNQELADFTQGMYDARALAMASVDRQATELGAHGLVGVQLDQTHRVHRVSGGAGGGEREDLIVDFHVLGTAIGARTDAASGPPPSSTIPVMWL